MKSFVLFLLGIMMSANIALAQSALTFGGDLEFLKKHVSTIVLTDQSGNRQVAIVPAYQGRVMTSTAGGEKGLSYGWVNRELISSGKFVEHINVFGGEDRFWLGPEGGQYSIFFKKGDAFDLEHWFTPSWIDTEPYDVVSKSDGEVRFSKKFQLTNYSGTKFDVEVNRGVKLLSDAEMQKELGLKIGAGIKSVAFATVNEVTNTGTTPWKKETGLLSVWILGMFNASPATTVAIPYAKGDEKQLGPVVNDTYFGKVPAERLVVKDGILYFAADAKYRSKIGLSPKRSKPILGSYDATNKVLTLVQFTLPKGVTDYVNSMWEIQKHPYGGDVVNSYNDGPSKPGAKQLGQFYELETSSPALALAPKKSAQHVHRTYHFQGPESELDALAKAALGVGIGEIAKALKK